MKKKKTAVSVKKKKVKHRGGGQTIEGKRGKDKKEKKGGSGTGSVAARCNQGAIIHGAKILGRQA